MVSEYPMVLPLMVRHPTEIADYINVIGIFWILWIILGWFNSHIAYITIVTLTSIIWSLYGRIGGILILPLSSICATFFSMITIILSRDLIWISGDRKFEWGSIIYVTGGITFILNLILYMIKTLYYLPYENIDLLGLFFFVSGLFLEGIGIIILGISFYILGDITDSDIIRYGGLILTVFSVVGGIIVGFGLKKLSKQIEDFSVYSEKFDEIKAELIESMNEKRPVSIKIYAVQKGIPIVVLCLKIREWIYFGDIRGEIRNNVLYFY